MDGEHAAVGHRLELPAQRQRLRPGFPRVQHLRPRLRVGERRICSHMKSTPGERDQPVVWQCGAASELDPAGVRIDRDRFVADAPNAPPSRAHRRKW